jgi:uridine kinase
VRGRGAGRLAAVVGATLRAEPTLARTRLVCVDGPSASGKTTLVEALDAALRRRCCRTTTLHMDDLYDGWTGLRPDLEPRVLAQVLEPLAHGRAARWQRYDWYAGAFADWVDLPPPDVLVLEGCGSGACSYAPYRSLLVWVDAPVKTRLQRWVDRDGPGVVDHREQWMAAEADHFALNATQDHADISLQGG